MKNILIAMASIVSFQMEAQQNNQGKLLIGLSSGFDLEASSTKKITEEEEIDIAKTFAYGLEGSASYFITNNIHAGLKLKYHNKKEEYINFDAYRKTYLVHGDDRKVLIDFKEKASSSDWSLSPFARYYFNFKKVNPSYLPFIEGQIGIANQKTDVIAYNAPYINNTVDRITKRDETYYTAGLAVGVLYSVTPKFFLDFNIGMDYLSGAFVNLQKKDTKHTAIRTLINFGIQFAL